jgi:hypothetical protein
MCKRWKNLVAWDNITIYYSSNSDISKDHLEKIKNIFDNYINNILYDGYINKNNINMNSSITFSKNK